MKSWPARALLLAGAAALLAIPAVGQQRESPQSLLPPGFGDPDNQPPPPPEKAPERPERPEPGQPAPGEPPAPVTPPPRGADLPVQVTDSAAEDLEATERYRPTNFFAIPEGTSRPTDMVGVIGPGSQGLRADAFGAANGVFLATLMERLDAPLPSRWASILLRRALLSRLAAPRFVDPVDWVAVRAALLLRMGEADAARMLVQSVDLDDYTPRMIAAAGQTALATADPAGLCPVAGPAQRLSDEPVWTLAEAICAGLEGEAARAGVLMDQVRRSRGSGIDVLLAEKVVGASAETRRAVTVQWEGVDSISPWRFGLASATGMEIPERLMAGAGPQIHAWLARAPMVPIEQRLEAAAFAAALGVFSSRTLVDIHSLMLDQTDPAEAAGTVGARLRTAWTHPEPGERLEALRELWREPETAHGRYARLILTAGAAARIPVDDDHGGDADDLIAAMLSAGMDRQAARWAGPVAAGDAGARAWALLALGAPNGTVDVDQRRIGDFAGADESPHRRATALLIAGLAGLGRLPDEAAARLASDSGFRLGGEDAWSAALDRAVRERQPGTVVLLAGIGMQARDWSGVPPRALFRIVRALAAVGLEFEARMIAAEAVARL